MDMLYALTFLIVVKKLRMHFAPRVRRLVDAHCFDAKFSGVYDAMLSNGRGGTVVLGSERLIIC
jgi:hypothetical protein